MHTFLYFLFCSGGWVLQEEEYEGGGGRAVAGAHFGLWCWRESIDVLVCCSLQHTFKNFYYIYSKNENCISGKFYILQDVLNFIYFRLFFKKKNQPCFLRQFCHLKLFIKDRHEFDIRSYTLEKKIENKDTLLQKYWINPNHKYFFSSIFLKGSWNESDIWKYLLDKVAFHQFLKLDLAKWRKALENVACFNTLLKKKLEEHFENTTDLNGGKMIFNIFPDKK